MDTRRRKLRFRAWRRGFRELDLILGSFAEAHLEQLNAAELDDFENWLEQPDQDAYAWISGRAEPPEKLQNPMLDRLRAHTSASNTRKP